MSKLKAALPPFIGVYCRWCDTQKGMLNGIEMCPHCDFPCTDMPDCYQCVTQRERTDDRNLGPFPCTRCEEPRCDCQEGAT